MVEKRILRYWRALREASVKTWNKVGRGYDKVTITTTTPIDIKLNNASEYHKVFGVSVSFAISD